MDIETIENITAMVNSIGFPIVACGALFWLNVRIIKKLDEAMRENTRALTDLHREIRGDHVQNQ